VREIDFILTDHGEHGIGITSPQLPGLVAGVAAFENVTPTSLTTLAREAAGEDVDGFIVHVERLLSKDSQIFAIRCKQDYVLTDRTEIADSLVRLLESEPEMRLDWPSDALGDVHLVAALGTDRVGAIARSFAPGEPIVAVFREDDYGTAVGIQDPSPEDSLLTVAQLAARASAESSGDARPREFAFTS